VGRALAHEDSRRKLAQLGYDAAPTTPEAFAAILASDMKRYGALVRQIGLKRQ
jgi:tripartite-type tricarboxylate transporter receptor subunit TctC